MANFKVSYKGDLSTEITHLDSGTKILTDAPVDNQGKGEKFSPTDLVASALGSCMLTIMGITADVQNIDILNARAKVEKIMGKNPRKIDQINIEIIFKSPISNKHKIILERAAKYCPVGKTLANNIKENVKFIYP